MRDPSIYPSWEQASGNSIPPRSYLYHLPPVGLGSAVVESLTSYVARLAEAHDISPGTLVTREILPKVREEFRRHDYKVPATKSTFMYEAHTLNSVGQGAQDWVNVLEQLTGVRGLQYLTMGTWRQIISGVDLLRRRRAWCPLCLEEWRGSNQQVYEPLLWALKEVAVCPTHACLLADRCPNCGGDQHLISAKVKPGHCCRCRCWLGMNTAAADVPPDIGGRVALAKSIGELLSIASTLAQPPGCDALLHNLKLCIQELADGSMNRFVAATGISYDILIDWDCLPERSVRLVHLCRICTLVGISLRLFVCERLSLDDFDYEWGRKAVAQKTSHIKPRRSMYHLRPALEQAARAPEGRFLRDVANELGYTSLQALRQREPILCDHICPKRSRRKIAPDTPPLAHPFPSNDTIKNAITAALRAPVSPPLKAITRELGFRHVSALYTRFPELCQALVEKYARDRKVDIDRCRERVAAAADQALPLTVKEVAAQVGLTVSMLNHRYPDLCEKIVARASERKALELERQRREFQAALDEPALPTTEALSARIGVGLKHFGKIHPDLYAQYRERSDEARRLAHANRRAAFEAEIRSAAIELIDRGLYPSRRRVILAIPNPSMRHSQILSRQVAAILLEIKLAWDKTSPSSLDPQPGSLSQDPSAGRAVVEP
jgi:AcrR family transcriptional regulator